MLNKLLKILKKIFSSKKNSKNTHRQIKSNSWFRDFIDLLIEHHFFKPISLSIILCFAIFKSYDYASYYFAEYREKEYRKIASTAIKINISDVQIDFDIEEDQILERRIKQGDTLLKILSDIGSSEQDIFAILNSLKKHTSVQNLGVGDMISVIYRSKIQLNKTSKENSNQNDNVNRKVIVNSVTIPPTPNTIGRAHV